MLGQNLLICQISVLVDVQFSLWLLADWNSENILKIFYNNLIFSYCGPPHPLTIAPIVPIPTPPYPPSLSSPWSVVTKGFGICIQTWILIYFPLEKEWNTNKTGGMCFLFWPLILLSWYSKTEWQFQKFHHTFQTFNMFGAMGIHLIRIIRNIHGREDQEFWLYFKRFYNLIKKETGNLVLHLLSCLEHCAGIKI